MGKPPKLHFVDDLFQEPAFLQAWASLIKQHVDIESLDHIIFSYHGVPEKRSKKLIPRSLRIWSCCHSVTEGNRLCYRMQCVQTTLGITRELGWEPDKYTVAFQSVSAPCPGFSHIWMSILRDWWLIIGGELPLSHRALFLTV